MLRGAFSVLLLVHGGLHLLGFVKAFNFADVGPLKLPISHTLGLLWLLAALGFLLSAGAVFLLPGAWWKVLLPSVFLSLFVIASSFADAKYGLLVNALITVPLLLQLSELRSSSFAAVYLREVDLRLGTSGTIAVLTDADLVPLPSVVQHYIRRAGAVGKPRVQNLRAKFKGELRRAPNASFMTVEFDQHDFFEPPARLFLLRATLYGLLPFEALHLYRDREATMQARALSWFDIVDVEGGELMQSETVTVFNDMCLLAPATLVSPNIKWKELDGSRVLATFSNAGQTISAELSFDAAGDLTEFVSHDRYQSDGKVHNKFTWSTPVSDYRDFDGVRLARYGEARWHEPQGTWSYARVELLAIQYNVSR